MPTIIFNTYNGQRIEVTGAVGSLLDIARDHNIVGIEGDCGGVGSCGTCHVHIAQEWLDKIGPASGDERDVVEQQPNFGPCSRLCCQIEVTAELDGLELTVPPRD